MLIKAILFDRDATLNKTTQILRSNQSAGDKTDGYVLTKEELSLFPSVKPALSLLKQNGIKSFVFTQQNCIGKGLITADGVQDIHNHLNDLIAPNAKIEEFYVAWNTPDTDPSPRAKPNPAMILEILNDHNLQKDEVIAVGDSMRDYQCAKNAGVGFVWIRDDLNRISEHDMQATKCAIYDNVFDFVTQHLTLTQGV